METQRWHQMIIRHAFVGMLVLLATGCGGGGGSTPGGGALALTCEPAVTDEVVHADAGNIVAVRVNESATLNGCASSTTLTAPLTYSWAFSSMPEGSTAQLQGATSVSPSFIADVPGTYAVQLVVSADGINSRRAIAAVEVSVDGFYTGYRVHTSYPSQCSECHDGRFALGAGPVDPVPTKIGAHPPTSNMCQACHTTFGFNLLRQVDHLEVFGNCSSCHDGGIAIGKSQFHVATTAECDNCHDTTSFLTVGADGSFDHTGITGGCERCHNGTVAIGKYDGHFVTTKDCGSCHNTVSFKDAFVDHSNITQDCASCHDGVTATGQTVGHPVMSVDCSVCHNVATFSLGGTFNHRVDPSVQPCGDCHNDNNSIGARGKSSAVNHVPTTADCGVCHGVGGGNFANGIFDHSTITDVNNCSECHGDSGNGTGPLKPANHMPTTEDCSVCHTPGSFATGVYDHAGVVSGCTTCHNGVISAGKPFNHIPTTPDDQDCADCHVGTDTFKGAVFNHSGITNNCASCHDGTISPGMSINHMPTTRDCSDCHDITNFVDFTGGVFDHLDPDVTGICASCHDGVIALGKKFDHIPAQAECSQCHLDTSSGGFASSVFLTDVHVNLVTGCEGCHVSRFFAARPALVKATTHVPTTQDCHFCHTNDAFSSLNFTHAGITGNCESCHDGSYSTSANALGKADDPTPPHPDTTEDCGVCHGIGASFANGVFDHTGRVDNCNECHADGATGAVTKKGAGHVPTTQDCSVCHVPGTFATAVFDHQGIVDNCAQCHDGSVATATVKSTSHIPTTEDCSVCHNTTAFAGAKFDHQGVVDNCATCHDGVTAIGKHGNHVPTSKDCSVCHLTTGFIPATFDHAGIVDNCASCHDGAIATGKNVGHVQTSADCGLCHNLPTSTTGFIPATFDHSAITTATRCDSCHGVTATGMDAKVNPAHLPTTLDCRSCHTTATFVGGTWVHDSSTTGVCDTCHNGTDATPKPSTGHISTDLQCDACHSTDAWAPTNFSHDPSGDYPGDHRNPLTCDACHGSIITTPFVYPDPQYAPYCAACHKNNFRAVSDHNGGRSGTVEQNKDCTGGGRGCHRVSSSSF